MNLSLLHTPDGVRDFYGTELDNKNYIMNRFENNIKLYGFDEIQTPALEFLKVFSELEGSNYENKTFRFIDRDGETLALRPDYTPSVARIAAKYFSDEDYPLRFYYKGNAFWNKGIYEGKAIEETQMGIELLKDDTYVADAEVLSIVIENLKLIGLEDFKICVWSKETNCQDRLEKIKNLLNKKGIAEYMTIDPTIDSNYLYYTGMIFKVYTYGVGDCICKGGRYNTLLGRFGENAPAVGCVFKIDDILQSLRRQKIEVSSEKSVVTYVIYNDWNIDEQLEVADKLRKDGINCAVIHENLVTDNFKKMVEENGYITTK